MIEPSMSPRPSYAEVLSSLELVKTYLRELRQLSDDQGVALAFSKEELRQVREMKRDEEERLNREIDLLKKEKSHSLSRGFFAGLLVGGAALVVALVVALMTLTTKGFL